MSTTSTKRILFSAYAFYPEFGGLEQQIYLLAQEYIKKGYKVDVLTEKTRPYLSSKETIEGITVYRMPYQESRSFFSYLSLLYHLSVFIIQKSASYDFIILRAALTLYPLVFGFWKFFGFVPAPTYVTADTGGEYDEIIIVKRWPLYKLMVFFFNQHTWLNSVCQANYEHYLQLGFSKNKLTQIPNGIEMNQKMKYSLPKKVNNFIFIGRFIKEKGIAELLEAFSMIHKRFPKAKLYIAGGGPELLMIRNFIKEHNLESSILLLGVVSGKNKEKFFKLGECLVLPSYSEGFGLVVAEAALRKKYIISTDVADIKKVYGNNVMFCNKKDPKSLASKMENLLKSKQLSKIKYEDILPQYNIKIVANTILSLVT